MITEPHETMVAGADDLERYLELLRRERNLSPHTLRNYRADLTPYLTYLQEQDITLTGVTRAVYRNYLSTLQRDGMAAGSVRRRGSTIKSFFKHLFGQGVLATNPLKLAGTPKIPQQLPTFLSVREVEALIAAPDLNTAAGLRDRAVLEVLYGSGLRVSELVTLQQASIDWESAVLRVWAKGSRERVALLGEHALIRAGGLPGAWPGGAPLGGERGLAVAESLWGTALGPRRAVGRRPLRGRRGFGPAGSPASVAAFICHSYARRRCGRQSCPGAAGPRQRGHDSDLHARDGVGEAGLLLRPR